jgi:hypothetical protein
LSESFPIDGRLYVFSALRPAPPPEGSLHLVARDADWLSACVIGLVVIAGLILIPFGGGKRVLVVGVLVIGLVILGVFNPILARQMCDGALASACLIVLVLWVVWYFVWTLPRARARRRAGEAGSPPGPATEPASPSGAPPDSPQPEAPPEPAAPPPGASTPSPGPSAEPSPNPAESQAGESAIEWDPSQVEQSSDGLGFEEPPAEDASPDGWSREQEPDVDCDEGGRIDV